MAAKIKRLYVFLNGDEIGTLDEDAIGHHVFTYDPHSVNQAALSLSMPRRLEPWRGAPIESYIDGILPDAPDVRRSIARSHGVNANNPFSLLTAVGLDCAGAVQFAADPSEIADTNQAEQLRPISEAEIGKRLETMNRAHQPSWQVSDEHWSVGGAQDKIALRRGNGRWFEALGSAATTHIIKPGIHELQQEAFNEVICMNMLASLDIPAAKTAFETFGSVPALVSERWDRRTIGDGNVPSVQRIHQEDLCQAMAISPAQKYQAEQGPGAVDIIKFLRGNGFSQLDVLMFIMALVFNFLIAGKDAHAKNYAILEQPGKAPQLAPLYDVASAFAYESPKRNYRTLAMSIDGEYNYDRIELHHWQRFAQAINSRTSVTFIENILQDLAHRVPVAFEAAATMALEQANDMPALTEADHDNQHHLVEKMREGITHQCMRVLEWFT